MSGRHLWPAEEPRGQLFSGSFRSSAMKITGMTVTRLITGNYQLMGHRLTIAQFYSRLQRSPKRGDQIRSLVNLHSSCWSWPEKRQRKTVRSIVLFLLVTGCCAHGQDNNTTMWSQWGIGEQCCCRLIGGDYCTVTLHSCNILSVKFIGPKTTMITF